MPDNGIERTMEMTIFSAKATEKDADREEDAKRIAEAWQNEYVLRQAIYNAQIDVSKRAIEQVQARAEFMAKAAGTIATAYTAILGLSYSIELTKTDHVAKPLPIEGLIPMFFLGMSIICAAVYLGYIARRKKVYRHVGASTLYEAQYNRLVAFADWVVQPLQARRKWMHASIYSLGIGIFFLPAAYLATSPRSALVLWFLAAFGLFLVVVLSQAVDPVISSEEEQQKERVAGKS